MKDARKDASMTVHTPHSSVLGKPTDLGLVAEVGHYGHFDHKGLRLSAGEGLWS